MVRDCSLRFEGKDQCVGYKRNVITYNHIMLVDGMIGKEIEEPLTRSETVYIHKWIRDHYAMDGDYPYYGTERVYSERFKGDAKGLSIKYALIFEGSFFQMSLMDQTVVAYVIMNKYWDAYIEIVAFSYLMKRGASLENKDWDVKIRRVIRRVSITFRELLATMTKKRVKKSTIETEADKTRAEMMKWACQVSGGRILEGLNIHDVFPLQEEPENVEQEVS
jgi:hypothetical protein